MCTKNFFRFWFWQMISGALNTSIQSIYFAEFIRWNIPNLASHENFIYIFVLPFGIFISNKGHEGDVNIYEFCYFLTCFSKTANFTNKSRMYPTNKYALTEVCVYVLSNICLLRIHLVFLARCCACFL